MWELIIGNKIKILPFLFILLIFHCCILYGTTKGLYIKNGCFYKDDKIVNAHGVNYFNVF